MTGSWLLLLIATWVPGCSQAPAAAPYRLLPDVDLRVFGCAPAPGHHVVGSQAELARALAGLSAHCSPADFEAAEAALLADLQRASIRWQDEAIVVLSEWYGTGMAKAHVEFASSEPGILEASIVWVVPPPPVTPDTAVFRCAFAVDKAVVSTIRVSGKDGLMTELEIGR